MATQDDDLAGLSDEGKRLLQVLETRLKTLIVAEIKNLSTGVQRQLDAISRNIDDLILEASDDEDDEDDDEQAETNGHQGRREESRRRNA